MSVISLSDDFKSKIWNELKLYFRSNTPDVSKQVLYMCSFYKRFPQKRLMHFRPTPLETWTTTSPLVRTLSSTDC